MEREQENAEALYQAAERGDTEAVRALLQRGARNHDAFVISARNGRLDIVRLLLPHSSSHPRASLYALQRAVENRHNAIVDFLFENIPYDQATRTVARAVIHQLNRNRAPGEMSTDGSRGESADEKNKRCYSFISYNGKDYFYDPITTTHHPLNASRIIRLYSVEEGRQTNPKFFCFDAVVLHDYLEDRRARGLALQNPVDSSVIGNEDFRKIAQKAAALNYEPPEEISDVEEDALYRLANPQIQQQPLPRHHQQQQPTGSEDDAAFDTADMREALAVSFNYPQAQAPIVRNDTSVVVKDGADMRSTCVNASDPLTLDDIKDVHDDKRIHVRAPSTNGRVLEVCLDADRLAQQFQYGDFRNPIPALRHSTFSDNERELVVRISEIGKQKALREWVAGERMRHLSQ